MRDPKRIPVILENLRTLWELQPDIRLGQLICNLVRPGKDPFNVEDSEMEKRIQLALEELQK